jgi:hypothetical protein
LGEKVQMKMRIAPQNHAASHVPAASNSEAGKILILTFVHNLHLAENRRTLILLKREESGRETLRLAAGFFIDYP